MNTQFVTKEAPPSNPPIRGKLFDTTSGSDGKLTFHVTKTSQAQDEGLSYARRGFVKRKTPKCP